MSVLSRLIRHLRANVIAYLALFVALGWSGAYAAQKVGQSVVKSKQIKDGQVKTQDLADGAVSAAKIAPGALPAQKLEDGSITGAKLVDGSITSPQVLDESVTGSDVDEASLTGLDAAGTGGMLLKKINFQVPFGTAFVEILRYPGDHRLDGQCQSSGSLVEISARTAVDNSSVSVIAQDSLNSDDRTSDPSRDIASRADEDLDPAEAFLVDSNPDLTQFHDLTVEFSHPGGFVATTHLHTEVNATGCKVTGISIGG